MSQPSDPPAGSPFAELLDAAIAVAAYPPAKGGQYVHAAKVPWTRIQRLRDAFDAAGIEWRDEGAQR